MEKLEQAELIVRLRAVIKQLDRLFGHISGINDERDSVPILLEARRIVALATPLMD